MQPPVPATVPANTPTVAIASLVGCDRPRFTPRRRAYALIGDPVTGGRTRPRVSKWLHTVIGVTSVAREPLCYGMDGVVSRMAEPPDATARPPGGRSRYRSAGLIDEWLRHVRDDLTPSPAAGGWPKGIKT